jgi:uncharacterized protein YbcI
MSLIKKLSRSIICSDIGVVEIKGLVTHAETNTCNWQRRLRIAVERTRMRIKIKMNAFL